MGRHFEKHQVVFVFEEVPIFHTAAKGSIMTRDPGFIDVAGQHCWRSPNEEVRQAGFSCFDYHTNVPNIPVSYRFHFIDILHDCGYDDCTSRRMTQQKFIKGSYVGLKGTAPSLRGHRVSDADCIHGCIGKAKRRVVQNANARAASLPVIEMQSQRAQPIMAVPLAYILRHEKRKVGAWGRRSD